MTYPANIDVHYFKGRNEAEGFCWKAKILMTSPLYGHPYQFEAVIKSDDLYLLEAAELTLELLEHVYDLQLLQNKYKNVDWYKMLVLSAYAGDWSFRILRNGREVSEDELKEVLKERRDT